MFCWDSSLESPSQKQFTGKWAEQKHGILRNVLPQDNRTRLRTRPADSLRVTIMTVEQCADGSPSPSKTLVLYDGVCGLCNRLLAFLIRHDRRDEFRFAPLQSEFAQSLLNRHNLDSANFNTVVVLADFQRPSERAFTRSQAALWCVSRVGGVWRIFAVAKLLPLRLREALYRALARRRYQIFGKYEQCPLPKPEDRHKFL